MAMEIDLMICINQPNKKFDSAQVNPMHYIHNDKDKTSMLSLESK
jgi:trehalose-6-phosphate synthase